MLQNYEGNNMELKQKKELLHVLKTGWGIDNQETRDLIEKLEKDIEYYKNKKKYEDEEGEYLAEKERSSSV